MSIENTVVFLLVCVIVLMACLIVMFRANKRLRRMVGEVRLELTREAHRMRMVRDERQHLAFQLIEADNQLNEYNEKLTAIEKTYNELVAKISAKAKKPTVRKPKEE